MTNTIGQGVNPEQENVYYSTKSLKDALRGLVTESKLEKLDSEVLGNFYLPVFVLDKQDINAIVVDIFERPFISASVASIYIRPTEIVLSTVPISPPTTVPTPEDSVDKAVSVDLMETFHSSNSIKETTWKPIDSNTSYVRTMDVLASTKSWWDNEVANNKILNSKILVNLVKESLKTLPEKTLEKYRNEYENIEEEIDKLTDVLLSAKEVQENSLKKLKPRSFIEEAYSTQMNSNPSMDSLENLILQCFYDFYSVDEYIGTISEMSVKNSTQRWEEDKDSNPEFRENLPSSNVFSSNTETSFKTIWDKIILSAEEPAEKRVVARPNSGINSYTDNILSLGGVSLFGDQGVLNGWFQDSLVNKMSGKDPTFESIDQYLKTFKEKTHDAYRFFKLNGGGGSDLLLEQAVYKSILSLCESNLDVSSYSPVIPGHDINIFTVTSKSGILGPGKTYPFPNMPDTWSSAYKTAQAPEGEKGRGTKNTNMQTTDIPAMIEEIVLETISNFGIQEPPPPGPFSKSGFLCFHALLEEISTLFSKEVDEDVLEYLANNLSETNSSSHYVAKKIVMQTPMYQIGSDDGQGVTVNQNKAYHVTESNDSSPDQDYWLVMPNYGVSTAGQESIPEAEDAKSYFSWHRKGASCLRMVRSNVYLTGMNVFPNEPWAEYLGFSKNTSSSINYEEDKGLHFGWASPEGGPGSDMNCSAFYLLSKHSNLINVLNVSLSLARALASKIIFNLLKTYEEISGEELDVSPLDILLSMSTVEKKDFLTSIKTIVDEIRNMNETSVNLQLNHDGTKSIIMNDGITSQASLTSVSGIEDSTYLGLSTLCSDYLQFISRISNSHCVKIVSAPTKTIVPAGMYIPIEAKAIKSNPYFDKGVGISDGATFFQPTNVIGSWDILQFTEKEFREKRLIKKNTSAISSKNKNIQWTRGNNFIERYSVYYNHLSFLFKFSDYIKKFRDDIDLIQADKVVVDLFSNNILDKNTSLADPQLIINQIKGKRNSYRATSEGISKRIVNALENLPTPEEVQSTEHIYVIGLTADLFEGADSINIIPQFKNLNDFEGSSIVPVGTSVTVSYNNSVIEGEKWLNYLHIVRGLDIGMHSFSSSEMPLYSKEIIKNSVGLFDWSKKDFENGVPSKPLDTIWNMSPWLFPRNYFYDVVDSSKYHKIIAITISSDAAELLDNKHSNQNLSLLGSVSFKKQ